MLEKQVSQKAPEVTLLIEVAEPLGRLLDGARPLQTAALRRLTQGVSEVLETLGVLGLPSIRIAQLTAQSPASGGQLLRLFVNGQLCRYSNELLRLIRSYLSGRLQDLSAEPAQTLTWLNELSGGESAQETLAEFLNLLCLEAIKSQPSVLLGPEQLKSYRDMLSHEPNDADLPSGAWPPEPTWLHPILSRVLDLKISLADRQTVAAVLAKGISAQRAPEDLVEDLISALRPDVVEIHLPQEYLRELTLGDEDKQHDKFSLMRDGLFYELGLKYPSFRFALDADLKPRSFAFKINHLTTLPRLGLQPNQCLVNGLAHKLELMGIPATPTINPATGFEFSLIDSGNRGEAEADGLTGWSPLEYLVLSFSVDLRANSACLLHRQATADQLAQVEGAFPALVKDVRQKFPVEQITRVLRALSAEQISLLNLRLILEALLDFDYLVVSPQQILFDDRLPTQTAPDAAWLNDPVNLASFVRTCLKRQLSYKYTGGRQTLEVYLLDPEIERTVLAFERDGQGRVRLAETQRDLIVHALETEVGKLSRERALPVILTSVEVRPALREIIAPEFPRLPVVAYQELSPETNIQPIARIELIA